MAAQAQPPAAAPPPAAPPPGGQPVNIEPPPPPPPPEELPIDQRTGFFLQFGIGGGYASFRDEYIGQGAEIGDDGTETASGGGQTVSFRIGGGVARGLVLGGSIVALGGTFEFEDKSTEGTVTTTELDASGTGVMLFLQKYIGPFFLRGELGVMSVASENEDGGAGFGFGLGAGADFLVSRSWALGFGANFHRGGGEYDETDYRGDASLSVFTVHFTATYF